MATIKSFTDLSQSKTLSTILPLESADMHYARIKDDYKLRNWEVYLSSIPNYAIFVEYLPCWSLAALLNVLPYPILCKKSDNTWGVDLWVDNKLYCTYASDKIDACYEMIIHLHELNLL